MNAPPRPAPVLLAERLQLVLRLSEANAACHRAQAAAGGAQFAVARIEALIDRDGASEALEAELSAAYADDDAALSRLAEIELQLDALNARLSALDRELVAAEGGEEG
jgi:hypothetical protein